MTHRAACAVAALLLASASPVSAATVIDPVRDFVPTFTGMSNADLDIVSASVTFDGANFQLSSVQNGIVGSSIGSLYVWGINRGAGTARLALGSPPVGAGVLFDAVAVLFPDGTARVATFPAMGAPVITPLPGVAVKSGNMISGTISASLLPSTGLLPGNYVFTLWSRLRVDPAVDGGNAEIADFAAPLAAAPEPASWAMMIAGMALVGSMLRRRGKEARAGAFI